MSFVEKRCYVVVIFLGSIGCTTPVDPPAVLYPIPSEAQLAWHQMEMNAFIHYTTNTFTNKEWGYGDESPQVFNPSNQDTDQWAKNLKEAGFNGVILTCKHHDGFCLWPSAYTEHSVKNSPYKDGEGDVVAELAASCKKYDLEFGVYVSPWDRNHPEYGNPEYITYYRNQLAELFTNYGPVFEMWFDGANGGDGYYGGANEVRKIDREHYYRWPETLDRVREMEPEVIFFSDAGPGVRWCGNERGFAGLTNWNLITPDTLYAGKAGITDLLNSGTENGTHWIPAEVDVSIRPGWFYHASEDSLVKTPEELFEIYLKSVGRGSTLLLNVPPDQRGLLHESDISSLQEFKNLLNEAFQTNLAEKASVTANSVRGNSPEYDGNKTTDNDPSTYWATGDEVMAGNLIVEFNQEELVHYVVLEEPIQLGQRIKEFDISIWDGESWEPVSTGTTVGYKRILKLPLPATTSRLKISITASKAAPLLSGIKVY